MVYSSNIECHLLVPLHGQLWLSSGILRGTWPKKGLANCVYLASLPEKVLHEVLPVEYAKPSRILSVEYTTPLAMLVAPHDDTLF
jgi:hypothetical protein